MSKNAYILEAFKQFDSLTEDEDVIEREEMPIYDANSEKMHDFLDTVGDDSDISIIDLEAEAEEDLKQSYVGKIILDCNVCHSNVFIDKDEIVVDDEGLANVDLECPYCMSNEGYTIIGQVEPYSEAEEEIPEEDIEIDIESEEIPDEEPIEEGMKLDGTKELKGTKKLWRRADKDGDKKLRGRANSEISGTEDLRESCELEDEDIEEGLITKDEYADKMEMVGKDAANHKIGDNEFEYAQDVLKQELDEANGLVESSHAKKSLVAIVTDAFENTRFKNVKVTKEKGGIRVDFDKVEKPLSEQTADTLAQRIEVFSGDSRINVYPEVVGDTYIIFDVTYLTESLKEGIEDVTINTEDETMTMSTKEDGGVVVETSPIDSEPMLDETETFDEPVSEVEPGEEVIAPISDEIEDEIELNSEVENLEDEDIEALEEPDEFDVEEFNEESFDTLGESYLRKQYDNVEGFKTVNAKVFNNSLIVEGVIRFNSGSSKGTSFVFEPVSMNKKAVVFEGYNRQISRGKKTFKLSCGLNEKMLTPNKMSYNYVARNELNESVRVNGTVKVK